MDYYSQFSHHFGYMNGLTISNYSVAMKDALTSCVLSKHRRITAHILIAVGIESNRLCRTIHKFITTK